MTSAVHAGGSGHAGILGPDNGPTVPSCRTTAAQTRVPETTQSLHHRGPDCQATAAQPHAHVGAARLRIVGLTAGDQPLVSAQKGAVLVEDRCYRGDHGPAPRPDMTASGG